MRFLYIIYILLIFSSCSGNKLKNQSDIESVLKKSLNTKTEITQNDWEKSDLKFEAFKADFELKKDNLTQEERDKANELIGRYQGLRIKQWANDLKQEMSDYTKQLEGVANELNDTTD